MYQPAREIIRSSQRDFVPKSPDMDSAGWQHISDNYMRMQEKRYQETNDLYDEEANELNSLNKGLENLSGQDHLYYQESIIEERNKLKDLFKGKNAREFRSPELQTEIFAAKSRLANKMNMIRTSQEQMNAVINAKDSPSTKTGEVVKYINEQMQLPPDQRDKDIIKKVASDPLFYNMYDDTDTILKSLKRQSANVKREDKDFIYDYTASYNPDLETYDEKTQSFEFKPSEDLLDKLLYTDPYRRRYNAMLGMIDPAEAKKMRDTGNDGALEEAVRQKTREFLKTVDGHSADLGKPQIRSKYHERPTASDKKQETAKQEIFHMQQRFKNGDLRALDDYRGGFWKDFQHRFNEDGEIISVIASYEEDDPRRKGRKIIKREEMGVDPDDPGSVAQVLNQIKLRSQSDKDKTTTLPMSTEKPKAKGSGRFNLKKQ